MNNRQIILGSFERVSLPKLGLVDVVAKIDTGAFSGAIHCTDIRVIKRGDSRRPVLQFSPAGATGSTMETDEFTRRYVRSSTGHRVTRYLIQTDITLKGKTYQVEIGLSDRSDMKFQVLIGRRFLRENAMLVDVGLNKQYDDEGDSSK